MIAYTIRGNHLYKTTNDFKVRRFFNDLRMLNQYQLDH